MSKAIPKATKAYNDFEFLNSPDARVIRMMAEFLGPQRRFRQEHVRDTIVFFGSARIKPRSEALARVREVRNLLRGVERSTRGQLRLLRSAEIQLELSRYYEDTVEIARLLTAWSKKLPESNRFVVCSGGGPGIMEAANKGACMAKGKSIGLNISLPFEQNANPYLTKRLNFEFHYFFMRKLWFVYLAKALVILPGGFGTLDELMEVLTLLQTNKIKKKMAVVIYGSEYWNKVLDFRVMADYGLVNPADLNLLKYIDTPRDAFEYLRDFLMSTYSTPSL
ncbi:MAG: putative Rossmann fold nucleotide-binding protein [Bacteroidetes bacterium]|nr:putative Rossmann fold nucleotide-binding protein [Bacteroidota bacterium]